MKSIDENTVRLTAGMLQTIECLVLALEATGALNRNALAYVIERRLEAFAPDALDSLPLAMLLRFLRPEQPPRPVLRLIEGGKAPP